MASDTNTPDTPVPDICSKILIADDNIVNQLVLKTMLDVPTNEILLADDGLIAVEKYSNQNFDIIFMDIAMPNKDGIQATREIRELEKAQNIRPVPIIAVTANVNENTEAECLRAGMNLYLTKPVCKSTLQETLLTFLGERQLENA